jgi:hypothetical protein
LTGIPVGIVTVNTAFDRHGPGPFSHRCACGC